MRKLIATVALPALVLWAVGCSDQPTAPETGTTGTNLTSEFGGYTAAPEAPAFGDTELLSEMQDEVAFSDPMLNEPLASEMVNNPESGLFHLRVVWGHLRYDSTATMRTDWSGSLKISRGVEIVRHIIRFERDQDKILPRTDRRLIEWVSATSVHNDGISVDMYFPPAPPIFDSVITLDSLGNEVIVIDTLPPEPVVIEFATGPYSRRLTLGELASLDTVIDLGDGNAVAMHGLQRTPGGQCLGGFLHGKWGFNEAGEGVFRGKWVDVHGKLTGFLKGHFGLTDDDRPVFFGKWITENGQFKGFLRGSWAPRPDENASDIANHRAGGMLRGEIFDARRNKIGVLKGRYKESERFDGGFFEARWRLICDSPDGRPGDISDSRMLPDGMEN